jgi:hypothetical protein
MQAGAPDINEKVPILAELLDGTEIGQDCDQSNLVTWLVSGLGTKCNANRFLVYQ